MKKISLCEGKSLQLSGSKSESNRALLLQALYPFLKISNLSTADDTMLLRQALQCNTPTVDIHHAGTAMRFLTAYFAMQAGRQVLLTGSERMRQRPIAPLVEALRALGAKISYTEKEGFPPLYIEGQELEGNQVSIEGSLSSQYITALLLIAPKLPNGLTLQLTGGLTSLPYLQMTVAFLKYLLGADKVLFQGDTIIVKPVKELKEEYWQVESDWSSASYWYSFVALSAVGTSLRLKHFKEDSLQGDSALQGLYTFFGVHTTFQGTEITLTKKTEPIKAVFEANLNNTPDIAQTIAVTCCGLGLEATLTGLHTLKIKETDRLQALQTELNKLGAEVTITDDSLHLKACKKLTPGAVIATYNDHRMAMAFAPLLLKTTLEIADKEVVSKSYPEFWDDVEEVLGVR
nr:3-phosphoshikimate 1-carboxyvinyltransferase [uncultured Capnocytophaga sp.]